MIPTVVVPRSLRVGEILALTLGFGLSTLAVSARTYTKARIMRKVNAEDYLSVLAWLAFIGYIGVAIAIGENSGGALNTAYVRILYTKPNSPVCVVLISGTLSQLSTVESLLYCPIILIVKLSILLQYLTIFVPHGRNRFFWITQFLIWSNAIYYFIAMFLSIFECTPREKLWNPSVPGYCFSSRKLGLASGSINVISDFSILILPVPIIWRLQMSKKRKVGITAVFGIGLFACVTSILRLVYSVELQGLPAGATAYQYDIDVIGVWSIAEIAVGIIVGCLPVLPRFFKHIFPKRSAQLSDSETLLNSSGSGSFWRRFFRRTSVRYASKELSGTVANSGAPSSKKKKATPQISTMNMTGHSLHMGENTHFCPSSPISDSNTDVDLERQYTLQEYPKEQEMKQHSREISALEGGGMV
ncbi:hypothetical protein MMC15_000679 [Xylographa vitiligo]|nr:hypothetical protein [Xylographa vitiligo]